MDGSVFLAQLSPSASAWPGRGPNPLDAAPTGCAAGAGTGPASGPAARGSRAGTG